jgi:hypothetical protein
MSKPKQADLIALIENLTSAEIEFIVISSLPNFIPVRQALLEET